MANIGSYTKRNFSPLSQILAYDPSGQVTSLIPGQSLLDYIGLPEFNEALINRVQWFTTNDVAKIEDLPLGRIIYTGGDTAIADGGGGHYVVVETGGSVVLDNGFELLLLPLGTVETGTGSEPVETALDNRWISKYTTDQLSTATSLRAGNLVRTTGKSVAGDGGICDYVVEERDGASNDGFFNVFISGTNLQASFLRGTALSGLTVSIPTDYPTLQAAIDYLYPRLNVAQGVTVTLNIESGHVITSTLRLDSGNYRWFTITSTDAEVLCNMPSSTDDLFQGFNYCDFATIATLFNMQGTGQIGLFIVNNGRAYIPPSSTKTYGIKNAGTRNVYAYRGSWVSIGSKLDSPDVKADFSGAGTDNLFAQRGSWIFANNTILTGAGEYAAHSRHGSHLVVNESDLRSAGIRSLQCTAGGFITCSFNSFIDPESWNVPPNMVTDNKGVIFADDAGDNEGIGVVARTGTDIEGTTTYSDGSIKAWKYIEVDSTLSTTQSFSMPVAVPENAKIYASGARNDNTSPVAGSGVAERSAAAASTVYGKFGTDSVGFRVTAPSVAVTDTLIGYMVFLEIPAV